MGNLSMFGGFVALLAFFYYVHWLTVQEGN